MSTQFDGENLLITLASGVTQVNVEVDLYSDWKEWFKQEDNAKYPLAFRTIGGDPLTPGISAGAYFFLQNQNGWRIKPPEEDITVFLEGNLAPEDSTLNIFVPTNGDFTAAVLGLQPVTQNVSAILELQQETSYNGVVAIDTIAGTSGTNFPVGTRSQPVNNFIDALTLASGLGVKYFELHGEIKLLSSFQEYNVVGIGTPALVDFNGQNISGSRFDYVQASGDTAGSTGVVFEKSIITGVSNIQGLFLQCSFSGETSLVSGTLINSFIDCNSYVPGLNFPIFDFQNNNAEAQFRGYHGSLQISNINDLISISIELDVGRALIDSSVVAGEIIVAGVGTLVDNSSGANVNFDGLVSRSTITNSGIADAVWEEIQTEHTTAGTMGESLNNVGGGADASVIADTVLRELVSDHQSVSGSLAESIMIIKGLVQNNFVLDNTVYNSGGLLTSGRIRIFSTDAGVNNAIDGGIGQGELASFTISATSGGPGQETRAQIYKVKKD